MARTNLKTISVYGTEEQHAILTKLAARKHRPLSNLLLSLALEEAEREGLATSGQVERAEPEKRLAARA